MVGIGVGVYELGQAFNAFYQAYTAIDPSFNVFNFLDLLKNYYGNMGGMLEYVKSVSPESVQHFYSGLFSIVGGVFSLLITYSLNLLKSVGPQNRNLRSY
ncbi:MAG: hypothetical protein QXR96_02870 [Candidatus Woesearchaeota archaeon]